MLYHHATAILGGSIIIIRCELIPEWMNGSYHDTMFDGFGLTKLQTLAIYCTFGCNAELRFNVFFIFFYVNNVFLFCFVFHDCIPEMVGDFKTCIMKCSTTFEAR